MKRARKEPSSQNLEQDSGASSKRKQNGDLQDNGPSSKRKPEVTNTVT